MHNTVTQVEFTNRCECEYVEDDDTTYPAEYCYGDCYEDAKVNLDSEVVQPWLQRNGLEEGSLIKVIGTNMDWMHLSGYAVVEADLEGFIKALSINSEYRIVYRLDGNRLTANRYSHDEPVGSPEFFFVPEVYEEEV